MEVDTLVRLRLPLHQVGCVRLPQCLMDKLMGCLHMGLRLPQCLSKFMDKLVGCQPLCLNECKLLHLPLQFPWLVLCLRLPRFPKLSLDCLRLPPFPHHLPQRCPVQLSSKSRAMYLPHLLWRRLACLRLRFRKAKLELQRLPRMRPRVACRSQTKMSIPAELQPI